MSALSSPGDRLDHDSASPAKPHEIPQVQILDRHEERSAWSTFHRIRYRMRGAGGEWIEGEREFLDRGDAVALLPYCLETGHILLTRQFRMPVYLKAPTDSLLLEICGGILDDPDPAVTAHHEALEELGIELDALERVFEGYSTPGSVSEKVYFFLAPYTPEGRRHAGGGLPHEGEEIEVVEMPLAEAMRLIRTGELRDVRTIALVLYLTADGRCSR